MPQSPLECFVSDHAVPTVAAAARETFLSAPGVRILFISGDVQQRPEVGDLAVVLRELLDAFSGRVHVALADRAEEPLFRDTFGIKIFPTLLFFRDGQPMGLVPGMKRWDEYFDLVRRLLGETVEAGLDLNPNPFLVAFNEAKRFSRF